MVARSSQVSKTEQADGILGGQLTLEAAAIVDLEKALLRRPGSARPSTPTWPRGSARSCCAG